MHLRSAVRKLFGILAIGTLLAGCGEGLSDSGPVEPNVGPGVPAGAKVSAGVAKKSTKAEESTTPPGDAAPAKK